MELINLAWANTEVHVAQGSWVGNLGSGGLGAAILGCSYILAKKEKGPWGRWSAEKIKATWDWKSLMSSALGFFGVTALLGATGFFSDIVHWLQSMIESLGGMEIFSQLGMAGICCIVACKVFASANDPVSDIKWGGGLALIFPLGGGIFAEASVWSANMLTQLMSGGLS